MVVSLVDRKVQQQNEVNTEIVEMLEDWLRHAKQGDIRGVALACTLRNGEVMTQCSSTDDFPGVAGAIAILQFRHLEGRPAAKDWE
jgi:hypothetical protein